MYQAKGTGRGSLQQGLAWAKEGPLGLVSGPTESEPRAKATLGACRGGDGAGDGDLAPESIRPAS